MFLKILVEEKTKMIYYFINVFVLLVLIVIQANCKIPDYIHVCKRTDPDVANCIKNSIKALIPFLTKGLPELEVPPIEPLQLPDITLHLGAAETKGGTNLTNINIWGASNFDIVDLKADIENSQFEYKVNVPEIQLKAIYEIDTKIMVLTLKGKGPIEVNITDYCFDCVQKGHKIQKDEETYLEFERMKCDLTYANASIWMENLFNGNALLENTTNKVLNENLNMFFKDIKPVITGTLDDLFTTISNKITLHFTYDELFP